MKPPARPAQSSSVAVVRLGGLPHDPRRPARAGRALRVGGRRGQGFCPPPRQKQDDHRGQELQKRVENRVERDERRLRRVTVLPPERVRRDGDVVERRQGQNQADEAGHYQKEQQHPALLHRQAAAQLHELRRPLKGRALRRRNHRRPDRGRHPRGVVHQAAKDRKVGDREDAEETGI
eukprot:scaffold140_cov247-Pinguiococcus_pyrenoidosus.AAC.2